MSQSWFLDAVLEKAASLDASDIYIQTDKPVFYRTPGGLVRDDELTASQVDIETALEAVLKTQGAYSKLFDKEEIDTSYVHNGIRFRVNICLSASDTTDVGAFIVMRRIKEVKPDPFVLGVPRAFIELCLRIPYGLVLICGPTGSGKSTTMASVIGYLTHKRPISVVTIEDPIEYIIPCSDISRVAMREVGKHTLSFASALRAAMRQKPDVVLVGEIRDPETAMAAVSVARSGHLVFSTLHTNMTTAVCSRIADMFPPERQHWALAEIVDVLSASMVQVLVKGTDGKKHLATEFLDCTDRRLKALLLEGKTDEIRKEMVKEDSRIGWTLASSLKKLVESGVVQKDEAFLSANDLKETRAVFGDSC